MTTTPAMQKNMYTMAHHAKFGKSVLTSAIMELINAINQASCKAVSMGA